jgi:hypothetical protein
MIYQKEDENCNCPIFYEKSNDESFIKEMLCFTTLEPLCALRVTSKIADNFFSKLNNNNQNWSFVHFFVVNSNISGF